MTNAQRKRISFCMKKSEAEFHRLEKKYCKISWLEEFFGFLGFFSLSSAVSYQEVQI